MVHYSPHVEMFGYKPDPSTDIEAKREANRLLLVSQLERLEAAFIHGTRECFGPNPEIADMIRKVKFELRNPPVNNGRIGPNGWGPLVDSLCWSCERAEA